MNDMFDGAEVAQILYEQFGDYCACNYNANDEWLPLVCDDGEFCEKHKTDPLYCWKQLVKHYSERENQE